jgi:two-component sensor histidine kinase
VKVDPGCVRQYRAAAPDAARLVPQIPLRAEAQEEDVNTEAAMQEALRALLIKDALINEVNHRTKNTLQVTSSLLSRQAHAAQSVEVRRALLDAHARLHLLALVHSMLCMEPNDSQSIFMPRLLQGVCDALAGSFGHMDVRLAVTCDPVSLPTDVAIPLALLSNEAVTNAYKHAFVGQASAQIRLQLRHCAEHAMVLRIRDNGTGIKLAQSSHGMGLKLMQLLAVQLDGVLDSTCPATGGTEITLTVPLARSGQVTACQQESLAPRITT